MVMDKINKILFFVMIGFLVFGFVNVLEDIDDKDALFEELSNNTVNSTVGLIKFWYGYSGITPSYVTEWIAPPETKVFMLEDIPLPDSTDLFVIIPLVLLTIFILKYFPYFHKGWGVFWAIMIVLCVILGSWVALKLIHYQLMLQGAETLGIDPDLVLSKRAELNTGVKDYIPTMLIMFIFTGLAVVKLFSSFWSKKKR